MEAKGYEMTGQPRRIEGAHIEVCNGSNQHLVLISWWLLLSEYFHISQGWFWCPHVGFGSYFLVPSSLVVEENIVPGKTKFVVLVSNSCPL